MHIRLACRCGGLRIEILLRVPSAWCEGVACVPHVTRGTAMSKASRCLSGSFLGAAAGRDVDIVNVLEECVNL